MDFELQQRIIIAGRKKIHAQIRNSLDQLISLTQTLKKATDNYLLTKAQYAAGGTTALDVLAANQLLTENRLAEIQARTDIQRLLARIDQLTQ
jgi:outer membrane protein TolC